jgi:hypothetical protein
MIWDLLLVLALTVCVTVRSVAAVDRWRLLLLQVKSTHVLLMHVVDKELTSCSSGESRSCGATVSFLRLRARDDTGGDFVVGGCLSAVGIGSGVVFRSALIKRVTEHATWRGKTLATLVRIE